MPEPTIHDLLRTITDANAALAQAKAEQKAAAAAYRATPDGIAESMRQLEQAVATGTDYRTVRAMQRQHVQAERSAADEYQLRTKQWGHRRGDGILRGIETGGTEAFRQLIWRTDIYASVRIGPQNMKIALFHGVDVRTRTSLTLPGAKVPTLADIFIHAIKSPTLTKRFTTWLGAPTFTSIAETCFQRR